MLEVADAYHNSRSRKKSDYFSLHCAESVLETLCTILPLAILSMNTASLGKGYKV